MGLMLAGTSVFWDGTWQPPATVRTLTLVDPSTEEPLGSVPWGDEQDVDSAVRAARRAVDTGEWARSTAADRADAMDRLATAIEVRADALARLVSQEIGQPLPVSRRYSVQRPVAVLRYYAALLRERPTEEVRAAAMRPGHTVVRREPLGVVGLIVPWNYPQALTMAKLAPALAAGCSVVLKPAAETSLDAYLLAEAAEEAELPPGVFNLVPGGRDTGEFLVRHPGVDKIAFTGSTAAGRLIGAVCGELLRPVSLELGGKSAAIVLPDADLDTVAGQLAVGSFGNAGQTCFLLSRVLAPRSRYAEVVDALREVADGFVLGDPFDERTTMGPLVSGRQRDRVAELVASGVDGGARLVTGGGRPAGLDRGFYFAPTVFADVDNASRIAREEVFGPVVCVLPYADEEQAVAIANDSEYGLGGSVFTTDPEHGLEVARRIQTGTIGINGYAPDVTAPFGGYKASGLGRENGPEAIASYENVKSMYVTAG
ncbi:acyl-CoA reductase-like NAD-dependent aldehyde dehydrogenase [Plantactinospora soyae]|uniref:Acyl-CoA reductase-like NAD-dependent aldehyde dehydrogenase n=2 Tax=Plantactinospora soyae TaxID=1544732 RepID=A0A927MCE6_9ACTN|nr:acyl-CoA reductase-like NAD-dependent aldehyde dehydrogenase [Plantactinospora soyae]